ncbi:hypothetical protein Golomagni_00549 [Golovinomyces magnicellulatus]|nr:hypothetical protein Golomagni_00549 [Golovinomyces magnicellulatus]
MNVNKIRSAAECFELMSRELQRVQRGLGDEYRPENTLRDRIVIAYRDVKDCTLSTFKSVATLEGLVADIISAISTSARISESSKSSFCNDESDQIYYTDQLERIPEDHEFEETDEVSALIMEMNFSDDEEDIHYQGQYKFEQF